MLDPAVMAKIHAAAFDRERPWSPGEFATLCESPFSLTVGDSRAFALARVIGDEAELLTIATHPVHRRLGLARTLMAAWESEAAKRGATRAFLEVAHDNVPAGHLYTSLGYRECGRRAGYYRRGDGTTADALIMDKVLTQG